MKNRIRVLRAEHRISQAEIAERIGVARQTVHAIENGKFSPSLTLGFKIASLFGSDINDVFAPELEDMVPSLTEKHETTTPPDPSPEHTVRTRPLVFFAPRTKGKM